MIFSAKPSRRETLWGGIYLLLYMCVLPLAVPLAAVFLLPQLNMAQVNFLYFGLNFIATTVIFHKFLINSVKDSLLAGWGTIWYAILGYLGSMLLSGLVGSAILEIYPEFTSVNDNAIGAMVQENRRLMLLGAVFLAPVTEELLFRGLIFRGLYDRSPLAAHLLTMVLFSLVHVTGYIGTYDFKLLFFCFLQYLAPAYCLNFAYQQSGTLISPILMHMLTNLVALSAMR